LERLLGITTASKGLSGLSVFSEHPYLFKFASCGIRGSALRIGKNYFLTKFYSYGNIFAFLAHISLATSVGFAYTQVLWKALKSKEFSIGGIDAVFDARNNILSLVNREMLWKMKVGWLLALIAW
jgi:hypothetical protein